jgi:hypothetical protein
VLGRATRCLAEQSVLAQSTASYLSAPNEREDEADASTGPADLARGQGAQPQSDRGLLEEREEHRSASVASRWEAELAGVLASNGRPALAASTALARPDSRASLR